MRRILEDTHINEDLPYKEKTNPQKTGTHNSLQLWHSKVVRSFNLTFGGYLAGTTPMLSIRSSLFIVQVLFRACKDYVAHWWFFGIITLVIRRNERNNDKKWAVHLKALIGNVLAIEHKYCWNSLSIKAGNNYKGKEEPNPKVYTNIHPKITPSKFLSKHLSLSFWLKHRSVFGKHHTGVSHFFHALLQVYLGDVNNPGSSIS